MTSQQNDSEPAPALTRNKPWVRRLGVAGLGFRGLGITVCGVVLCVAAAQVAFSPDAPSPAASIACNTADNRVAIAGGTLRLAPNDWEALGKVAPLELDVEPFVIDRYEVTVEEWAACEGCAKSATPPVLHTPRVNITAAEAQHFCETRGGRLPTSGEWTFAASSAQGYRYPWGQTGLVCRKAIYGMVNGPCGEGASAPSAVGTRDLGATPSGIYDLCGNVAEWVTDGTRTYAVGGSFRSTLAGQLKVWAREETATPRDDLGFRCVYDE